MLKTSTLVPPPQHWAANKRLPAQLISTPVTLPFAGEAKGEPDTGVSVPFAAMLNIATLSISSNATDKNCPVGLTLIPSGLPPAEKGEPATGVSAPFELMLKTVMLSEVEFAAIRN